MGDYYTDTNCFLYIQFNHALQNPWSIRGITINFRAPSFLNIFKVLSLKFELSIIRFTETNYHILITFYSFIKVYRIICGSSADKSFIAVYYMLFNVISMFFHMATSLINVFTWNPRLLSRVWSFACKNMQRWHVTCISRILYIVHTETLVENILAMTGGTVLRNLSVSFWAQFTLGINQTLWITCLTVGLYIHN